MNWLNKLKEIEQTKNEIMAFDEFMDDFYNSPSLHLRNSSRYLKDMFDFYGKNEKGGFNLFSKRHADAPAVAGQELVQKRIFDNLLNFIEEGFNHKFLLLVGPNGSAKSSIIRKIIKAMEDYSREPEGALYSFSWIFPVDNMVKGNLGLTGTSSAKNLNSYAHLEDTEILAIINSELHDHPFLLLPLKMRQEFIEEHFANDPDRLENLKESYFYTGDLSKRNRQIFDALLKNYKGDHLAVLKHIRVERYYVDKRYSHSCATIEPQLHVDAKIQQITMDRRLGSLPPSLQSLNLFSMSGEITLANRGILEFSDLLKRPLDTFKYLLMTMESKNINLQGILTELDIFFIGSSNEIHFDAFKNHPDFKSFQGRFSFIKVPYLMDYREELKIYQEQIGHLKDKTTFEPHAIEALTLWSVMSRMRLPTHKNYQDKKAGKVIEKLNPLEKALFISDDIVPDYLKAEEAQLLLQSKQELIEEFINDNEAYEGKFGISPREIKEIIYNLANKNKKITFIEVLDYLTDLADKKSQYDFLNIPSQGDYHNAKKFIYHIDHHSLSILDDEVRESLGLIDNRSYEDYISKYVSHITALLKNEKIKNSVTGKFEQPDQYFIKEFESNLHIKDSPDNFRSNILSKLGAYSLDNPGIKIIYTDVLDGVSRQLKESFRTEQKKIIMNIAKNLVFFLNNQESNLQPEAAQQIEQVKSSLINNHGYSEKGAMLSLQYLIKRRYEKIKD